MWCTARLRSWPFIFSCFKISDLVNSSELIELLLFAFDSSIFYSHSNPNTLESILNKELKNIEFWLRCNKLSVNVKKTTDVILKPRQKKWCNHNFSISLGGQLLTQTNVNYFLGHILTSTLLGKIISAIYVNKSLNQLNQLECYAGVTLIYLQK